MIACIIIALIMFAFGYFIGVSMATSARQDELNERMNCDHRFHKGDVNNMSVDPKCFKCGKPLTECTKEAKP